MEDKKDKGFQSEYQDFMRDNQRTDELRCASEEYFLMVIAPGGHAYLYSLIHAIDGFFRQFMYICDGKEREEMEQKYQKALKLADAELRSYNHRSLYGQAPATVPRQLIEYLRNYLQRVYHLRQSHGLAYRIREKKSAKEMIDNAFGAF